VRRAAYPCLRHRVSNFDAIADDATTETLSSSSWSSKS
jgi:hypothetical protein